MNVLHITNGDVTTKMLKKLHFKGEFITWRETLSEGRTTTEVGSENFWRTRYAYLKSAYQITKKTFIDYTLKEYRNLCNQKQQEEIVLWFEGDLFCQINMLAVISWLKKYRTNHKITLVQNNKNNTKFTDLSEKQITNNYQNRVELNKDDIEYADYIWQLYCSNSPLRLETVHKFNPMSPFIHLEETLKTHLQRFPSTKNGLNNIENFILKTANENQLKSKEELINTLISEQENFGFGDLQYLNHVQNMKKLFTSFDPLKISRIGKKVLENQMNFYAEMRSDSDYLGGTKKYSYLFINDTNKLLKITS